ncbi:MAG: DinB family protein [Bryobacterales bacterium]|nr:DinB family protein [Bryobacterales bacterium]MBV9400857.1 DinB family protein [Bryobacterales bacterium]
MAQHLSHFLKETIEREVPNLRALDEQRASIPRGAGKWCPKEELGHLIDSAANNHIRFVCGAIQPEYRGASYAQEDWVRLHGYRDLPWNTIVNFWFQFNQFLAALVANIPEDRLATKCLIAAGPEVTLGFVIEDYILHMQHHIDQMLRREKVATYPGVAIRATF